MTVSGTPGSPRSQGPHKVEGPTASAANREYTARSVGTSSADVSESAKQMVELSQLVRSAPDTRTELVEDIKGQIEAGTYQIDFDKLAERLADVV